MPAATKPKPPISPLYSDATTRANGAATLALDALKYFIPHYGSYRDGDGTLETAMDADLPAGFDARRGELCEAAFGFLTDYFRKRQSEVAL